MAIESVKHRIAQLADKKDQEELYKLLASLVDGLQAVMALLDADGGVTGTSYASTLATYVAD